jgi:hypothetical protein
MISAEDRAYAHDAVDLFEQRLRHTLRDGIKRKSYRHLLCVNC